MAETPASKKGPAATGPDSPELRAALARYEDDQAGYLEKLEALARIPSISFDGFPPEPLEESAQAVAALLRETGLPMVEILRVPGAYPYVFAEWLGAPGAPTLLLYAHHDVQPPMREELWKSPPFEPTLREGRLFARGIADDKAGAVAHAASVAAFLKTSGRLPINIKVLIEGEEETGSAHLEEFLRRYKDRLACDAMVLADAANYDTGVPSLTTTLRGLVTLEVTVTALERPLHSGMWGGPIPDPVMGLAKTLAGLVDAEGRLALPALLDEVIPPTPAELESLKSLGMTEALFRAQAGLREGVRVFGKDEEILLRMWREPSLVVNSIQSGGRKVAGNVIMDAAWCRIGLRLVPGLRHEKALEALTGLLKRHCPWGLHLEVRPEQGVDAWITSSAHPYFEIAKRAFEEGYGRKAVYIGCGGTIPFVGAMTRVLGEIPALLIGMEDPYTNAHSENESLPLADFHSAVRGQIRLIEALGRSAPGPARAAVPPG